MERLSRGSGQCEGRNHEMSSSMYKCRSRSTPHWRLRPNKTTNKLAYDTMIYMNHELERDGRQTLENGVLGE
jgi:hypothetical protein